MAVFNSEEAFKKYILAQVEIAITNARDEIYNIFSKYLLRYYNEYDPKMYQRTWRLLNSLIRTNVVRIGNTVSASVYFDVGALSYPEKVQAYINGDEVVLSARPNASKTLNAAMHGSHGGKASGTAVWDESMAELNRMAGSIESLILKELEKAGVPVK